jgi:hemerythrin
MIRIELDDDLRTGDRRVDDQHEALFGMFNGLHEAMTRGRGTEVVGPLIQQLHDYTLEHFDAEQGLMVEARLDAVEMLDHVEEHRQLTERVRELVLQYRDGGLPTVLPLATLLQEWLIGHIRKRDRVLAKRRETAGA